MVYWRGRSRKATGSWWQKYCESCKEKAQNISHIISYHIISHHLISCYHIISPTASEIRNKGTNSPWLWFLNLSQSITLCSRTSGSSLQMSKFNIRSQETSISPVSILLFSWGKNMGSNKRVLGRPVQTSHIILPGNDSWHWHPVGRPGPHMAKTCWPFQWIKCDLMNHFGQQLF